MYFIYMHTVQLCTAEQFSADTTLRFLSFILCPKTSLIYRWLGLHHYVLWTRVFTIWEDSIKEETINFEVLWRIVIFTFMNGPSSLDFINFALLGRFDHEVDTSIPDAVGRLGRLDILRIQTKNIMITQFRYIHRGIVGHDDQIFASG